MRIISLTICHYGVDYLAYALRSVHDAVDAQYVLYTPEGSHGHKTAAVCPDTREMLIEAAIDGAGDKLRWHEGVSYASESEHRGMIHRLEPDADCIIVVDADEVYSEPILGAIDRELTMHQEHDRRYRLPFWHYWRSFKRGFMHDPSFPERVIFPKSTSERINAICGMSSSDVVHHFGYATRSDIVRYKWQIHGHKNELRRDVDWFQDVFMANRQYDCHPVGSNAWNCENMDTSQLPSVLSNHPFKDMELIP